MIRRLTLLIIVLAVVFGCRVWLTGSTEVLPRQPMETFPSQLGAWTMVENRTLPPSLLEVLRLDSYISRFYRDPSGEEVELFVAYYRSQRAGENMHSPQNCLPGSGWQPIMTDRIAADLGTGRTEIVNRYLVEKDGKRALVLYWYQAHGRLIANEYLGKIYLVWDAIHLHRRDGAIIRLNVLLGPGANQESATRTVLQLARAASQRLPDILPN